jgi:tartrate dehydratase beta subunit/fumarate hydratase class I family protein
MRANVGDRLLTHGRIVGQRDRVAVIVEVMGPNGTPPYRVRFEDGHETVMSPGPDTVVRGREQ